MFSTENSVVMLIIISLCSLYHFSLAAWKALSLILIFNRLTVMNLDVADSSHIAVFVLILILWYSEPIILSLDPSGKFFFFHYFYKYVFLGQFSLPSHFVVSVTCISDILIRFNRFLRLCSFLFFFLILFFRLVNFYCFVFKIHSSVICVPLLSTCSTGRSI